jgi:hypothetical protein
VARATGQGGETEAEGGAVSRPLQEIFLEITGGAELADVIRALRE